MSREPVPVEIVCEVRSDDPRKAWIAVADGTQEADPNRYGATRDRWFFIPRSQILDCEPPLDAVPASGPRLVTLTIPQWLAQKEGLI